jgi:hypothetical protein
MLEESPDGSEAYMAALKRVADAREFLEGKK